MSGEEFPEPPGLTPATPAHADKPQRIPARPGALREWNGVPGQVLPGKSNNWTCARPRREPLAFHYREVDRRMCLQCPFAREWKRWHSEGNELLSKWNEFLSKWNELLFKWNEFDSECKSRVFEGNQFHSGCNELHSESTSLVSEWNSFHSTCNEFHSEWN